MRKKAPTPSPALIEATRLVLIARAVTAELKVKVDKIHADILADLDIKAANTSANRRCGTVGERITNSDLLYMASEADAQKFYVRMDAAYKAAGYKDLQPGYCPYLMADHDRVQAERLMVEEAIKFLPIKFTVEGLMSNFTNYKKFIELTLNYVTPFVAKEGSGKEILDKFMTVK